MNAFTNNSATQEGFDTLYASGYPVSAIALALDIPEYDVIQLCAAYEDANGANDPKNYGSCPAQSWEAEVAQQVAEQAQEQYEEYEANTTAELDAYLDQQLALQAELTKMRIK